MEKTKHILAIIGRSLLILMAALFILIGIAGIGGTWYVNRVATNVTLKLFSVVETGVSVADTGVGQALTRVIDSRSEIAQTEEDITTLGQNLKENHPALTALSERLDARLAPTVDKIRSALEPVKEGLTSVDAVLSVANSIPYFQEKAPGLQETQDSLRNIADLQADVTQLRTTLRAAAEGKSDALTDETTTLLLNITGRVDERLARTQSNLEKLQESVIELQTRIAQKKARLLFIYNLSAVLISLLFLWLIYSQVVVISAQVRKIRGVGCPEVGPEALPGPEPPASDLAEISAPEPPAAPEPEALPEPELPSEQAPVSE
jgi:hypothetical protein